MYKLIYVYLSIIDVLSYYYVDFVQIFINEKKV